MKQIVNLMSANHTGNTDSGASNDFGWQYKPTYLLLHIDEKETGHPTIPSLLHENAEKYQVIHIADKVNRKEIK